MTSLDTENRNPSPEQLIKQLSQALQGRLSGNNLEDARKHLLALGRLIQNKTSVSDDEYNYELKEEDKKYEKALKAFGRLMKYYEKFNEATSDQERQEISLDFSNFCETLNVEVFHEMNEIFKDELRNSLTTINLEVAKIFETEEQDREEIIKIITTKITEIENLLKFWGYENQSYNVLVNKNLLKLREILKNKRISKTEADETLEEINSYQIFIRSKFYLFEKRIIKEENLNSDIDYIFMLDYRKARAYLMFYRKVLKKENVDFYKKFKQVIISNLKQDFSKLESGKMSSISFKELTNKLRIFFGAENNAFKEVEPLLEKYFKELKNSNFDFTTAIKEIKDILNKALNEENFLN